MLLSSQIGHNSDFCLFLLRISGMVENLCRHWGTKVCDFPLNNTKTAFHSFPTIDALAANPVALEAKLRTLGFGYRAGYIAKSAKLIRDKGGEDYLLGLRQAGYEEARTELLKLTGIGPKVILKQKCLLFFVLFL